MYEIIKGIINSRNYNLEDLEERILKIYALGKLTDEQMEELLSLAGENTNDALNMDIAERIVALENRVSAIEGQGIRAWNKDLGTAKGQVVLYDIDGDGILDRVRYDGGRATTTSRPGNIEGWVLLDGDTPTHTISKVDGQIVLTPIDD